MTLFFQFNKNLSKKISTMNASALVVFLLLFLISTLAHADHITTAGVNAEQQDCYICYQGLDTPPDLSKSASGFLASYCYTTFDLISVQLKINDFVQPLLRAPPLLP